MAMIYRGLRTGSPSDVIDGRTIGLWWDPDRDPGCRPRRGDADLIVWHHTAGEGDAERVYRTLSTREDKRGKRTPLSVHFVIEYNGRTIQMADLATVTYHAGMYNVRSIGVEVVNRARPPASPRRPRETYRDTVHDSAGPWLRFTDAQIAAAQALHREICDVTGIPRDVRTERTRLTAGSLSVFRGSVGHYHLSENKVDPVPHLLDELAR